MLENPGMELLTALTVASALKTLKGCFNITPIEQVFLGPNSKLSFFIKVMDEIASMENNIRDLKQAIADKENPLKVAHTRLDKRSLRPNVELCRDPVQYRLVGEVGEITVSIDRLRMRLAEAEASLMSLLRNKERLEDDIEVKTNSLFIDRDQCMVIRHQVRHISH